MVGPVFQTVQAWSVITHLGSATLVLPTLALTVIGLWQSRQHVATCVWVLGLVLSIAITLVSKILFLGWGIGIASLNFTGISGHTLLATSVLPILFSSLLLPDQFRFRVAGAVFGLLLGAEVAVSRVVLGAHSVSEVVCAWLIGFVVTVVTVRSMKKQKQRPWIVYLAPFILLFAFGTKHSNYLPTHDWEINLALFMSGHETPYTRLQLHALATE
ncbi:phosphatase PAP2 family protein [Uliginosibacterium gangwonense]|uniref:phosphatase PAP2 family protein n=1 Tax=Uliginosibacterium gangwonense TaxID=392736 RepID=UPI00037BF22E|nr:phosphatase PAP2 family protein [Uliginosibacterium gangwonense]